MSWRLALRLFPATLAFFLGSAHLLTGGVIYSITPRVTGSSPASTKLRQSFAFLEQKKLPEAESGFDAVLRLDPNNVEACIGLAEIARERRQSVREEELLRRALEAKGGTSLAYRTWAHYQAAQNKIPEAEAAFRKAAGIELSSPEPLVELGNMDLAAGRPDNAILAFRDATNRDPKSYQAHLGLGSALAGKNQFDAAIAEFNAAARLNPTAPAPLLSIGLAYGAAGQRDKAIESLSSALELDPKFTQIWISRGDAFQAKGDSTRALADYAQALKLDPKAAPVQFKIGLVYLALNRIPDAERCFHAAVEIDPAIAQAWNDLAWLAADRRSDLDNALFWAKKAVALNPHDPQFTDTLAWVYRSRRQLDLAAQTIEGFPGRENSPVLLYHLGVIDSERGRKKEALLALQQSLSGGAFPEADQARKLMASLSH